MEVPVSITIKNRVLLGILNIPNHQYERPIVVIMCYGFNGDRVEQHRMSVTTARYFEERGVNFCRFDFRNQGLSEGCFDNFIFSEKCDDIDRIIEYLMACFRHEDIACYLIGFSNGCKVAIDALVSNDSITGVVLWNPILQELSEKNNDAGDTRRLYKHPITGKPYKRFYSLRLNTNLLRELSEDLSMTKLKDTDKNVLCILSVDDPSIRRFGEEIITLENKNNIGVEYVDNTDHLFGSVEKVEYVICKTYNWIINKELANKN